jgi:hypothetical protein
MKAYGFTNSNGTLAELLALNLELADQGRQGKPMISYGTPNDFDK